MPAFSLQRYFFLSDTVGSIYIFKISLSLFKNNYILNAEKL